MCSRLGRSMGGGGGGPGDSEAAQQNTWRRRHHLTVQMWGGGGTTVPSSFSYISVGGFCTIPASVLVVWHPLKKRGSRIRRKKRREIERGIERLFGDVEILAHSPRGGCSSQVSVCLSVHPPPPRHRPWGLEGGLEAGGQWEAGGQSGSQA